MKTNKKLVREQLDVTLDKFRPLGSVQPPAKGWVRAIRDALGMSGRQLALRMGVTKQLTSQIEKQEVSGAATLKTMRRTAEALDCTFVYALVPKTRLDEAVRSRARRIAEERLARASQTMSLEDQALGDKENSKVLSDLTEELIENPPTGFWDES